VKGGDFETRVRCRDGKGGFSGESRGRLDPVVRVDLKLDGDISYQLAEVADISIDQGIVSGDLQEGSLARRQLESLILSLRNPPVFVTRSNVDTALAKDDYLVDFQVTTEIILGSRSLSFSRKVTSRRQGWV
jgi:hypothetical protein